METLKHLPSGELKSADYWYVGERVRKNIGSRTVPEGTLGTITDPRPGEEKMKGVTWVEWDNGRKHWYELPAHKYLKRVD